MIPPLKPTDDAHKAIVWMEELRLNQLPVVDHGRFLGLISEEIILESNNIEKPIADFELLAQGCFVREGQHFYDIIKQASNHDVHLVGVLGDSDDFIGVITVQDTLAYFAQTAAVQIPGGIIVLSLDEKDYSLSEISRLVEENRIKVLSSIVNQDPLDPSKIKLTLKLNTLNLSHVEATLERFNYKVISRFQDSEIKEGEREKIDMLLKFLDI